MTTRLDIIIAGGGRVGFQTATLLEAQDHDVTIVERDSARCDAISDAYVATVIEGDASEPDILRQAGLDGCDVVAALTGEAGLNLAVCMEARELAPGVRTVARIDDERKRSYDRFVDGIVFPEQAGARMAVNEVLGADVQTLTETTGELDIMQVTVGEDAPAAGRTLREVNFPAGALVVSDADGDRVSRPETTLTPGKRYVVAVEHDVTDEVMNLLRG